MSLLWMRNQRECRQVTLTHSTYYSTLYTIALDMLPIGKLVYTSVRTNICYSLHISSIAWINASRPLHLSWGLE